MKMTSKVNVARGSCDLFEVPRCDISRWNENGGLEAPDIEFVVRRLQLKV